MKKLLLGILVLIILISSKAWAECPNENPFCPIILGPISIIGDLTTSETATFNGDVDIGDAATDTLTITSIIDSDVTLDDGTTDSPALILKDATDETFTCLKKDAGFLECTADSSDGLKLVASSGNSSPFLAFTGASGTGSVQYDSSNSWFKWIASGGFNLEYGAPIFYGGTLATGYIKETSAGVWLWLSKTSRELRSTPDLDSSLDGTYTGTTFTGTMTAMDDPSDIYNVISCDPTSTVDHTDGALNCVAFGNITGDAQATESMLNLTATGWDNLILGTNFNVTTAGALTTVSSSTGNSGNTVDISSGGDVTFVGSGGLAYGSIYTKDSVATLVVDADLAHTEVTSFTVNGDSNGVTSSHSTDKMTIITAGKYWTMISSAVEGAGAAAHEIHMEMHKNSGANEGANSKYLAAPDCDATCATNDTITFNGHGWANGDIVYIDTGTGYTNVVLNTEYYICEVAGDDFAFSDHVDGGGADCTTGDGDQIVLTAEDPAGTLRIVGTSIPNVHNHGDLQANTNKIPLPLSGIVDLAAGDTISIWIYTDDSTARTITVSDISFSVMQIGG